MRMALSLKFGRYSSKLSNEMWKTILDKGIGVARFGTVEKWVNLPRNTHHKCGQK
jgi:hypothetical protein